MDKQKYIDIANDSENRSNKDLVEARDFFIGEFDELKMLIIDLTRKLETVEVLYNKINSELNKRYK
jgi:hypothetical protein